MILALIRLIGDFDVPGSVPTTVEFQGDEVAVTSRLDAFQWRRVYRFNRTSRFSLVKTPRDGAFIVLSDAEGHRVRLTEPAPVWRQERLLANLRPLLER